MSSPALMKGSPGFSIFGTTLAAGDASSGERPLHPNQREGIDRLNAAFAESSVANWDDEGSAPASQLSRLYAERFLRSLGGAIVPPEVTFDRQGHALLEWRPRKGNIALISIGGAGEINYALRLPGGKTKGFETFSDAIPPRLLTSLSAVLR